MNKKIFSYSVWKEGVRQTRTIGLIGLILICLLTIIYGIFDEVVDSYSLPNVLKYIYAAEEPLLLQCYLFSPLMVLSLFRFLNQREALDVYYSLPQSRNCLHSSYFASVVFWNLLTTLSVIGIKLIFSWIFPYSFYFTDLFPLGLNLFAAQVGVAACVLLAMSITGTVLSNVMVSLVVMFLPRLGISAIADMISNRCVIMDVTEQYPFISHSMNLIAGIPINYLRRIDSYPFSGELGSGISQCYTNPVGGIYTLGLALVVFAFALWLLNKRNSDLCGKDAPSPLLHRVYRIALAGMLGIIPTVVFSYAIQYSTADKAGALVLAFVLLAVTAIVYFLFEGATDKKGKNLLRAIPDFLLAMVIDGAVLLLVLGVSHGVLSNVPSVEQLDGIYLMEYGEEDHSERTYFIAQSEKVLLSSAEAKTIGINALKESVGMVKEGSYRRGVNGEGTDLMHPDHFLYQYNNKRMYPVSLVFQEGNRQYKRHLVMSWNDIWRLDEILENSKEYQERVHTVPIGENTKCLYFNSEYDYKEFDFSEEQVGCLYQAMTEDIQGMPFKTWHELVKDNDQFKEEILFFIETQVQDGRETNTLLYAIDKTNFPKTVDLFMNYYDQAFPNALEELSQFVNGELAQQYDFFVDICYPSDKFLSYKVDNLELAREILPHAKPYTSGSKDVLLSITVKKYDESYDIIKAIFTVDEKYMEKYWGKIHTTNNGTIVIE